MNARKRLRFLVQYADSKYLLSSTDHVKLKWVRSQGVIHVIG